ncbi:MAG: hypothetical protein ACLFSU_06030, partial [Acholeplasmataceae bacterium]
MEDEKKTASDTETKRTDEKTEIKGDRKRAPTDQKQSEQTEGTGRSKPGETTKKERKNKYKDQIEALEKTIA